MTDIAAVTLLRPVRVLVAGDDYATVEHLREDLVRSGLQAMSTSRISRAAELASVERVNVVILETSGGLASAAAAASALEGLPHRVRVLLAGPAVRAARNLGYDIVDPNGPVEELAAAVHRAYRGGPTRLRRSSRS